MFEITRVRGIAGLEAVRSTWEALYRESLNPSFYSHWHWYESISRHLLDSDIHYFLLHRQQRCVAIVPLQLHAWRKGGHSWQVLRLPSHDHLEMMDALIHRDQAPLPVFTALHDYLLHQRELSWDMLLFPKVRARAGLASALLPQEGHVRQCGHSCYLQGSPQQPPEATLSHKHLKNISRLQRKLETEHQQSLYFHHCSDPQQLEAAFATFLQVEASGWKGEQGENTCISAHPRYQAHYHHLLQCFGPTGDFAVNLLLLGEQPLAAQLCIRAGQAWHLMKIGYDEAFQAYAPGNILLWLFIQQQAAQAQPWEVNLVTGPGWAERWHFNEEPVYRAEFFNTTLRGRLLSTLLKGKELLKGQIKGERDDNGTSAISQSKPQGRTEKGTAQ
ncbi:GNAT family N-acetyltransferase [Pokkaliibacter sp. MBI-7]|uniref:GNAT family N-acetyltransferase n=1 Tax=Pokkaliibacter sp. MBI-7 TaxID=3040600 RepID=UPI002446D4F0|nr:GNAT family N-acetyltransferase [Pokkaliibacter sp. MBI-7]MDH2433019.1 GNAT family N-acetyltransferase [Pokkaliibacter sp. MBI-7]